ncbi:MAG: hypothetical protein ABW360_04840, partial [Phenylobacterium sp.]
TSVEDDLAFMRSLAQPSDASQRVFGQLYFAAGLCYSVQMAGHAIHALAGLQGPFWGFLIGAGPSVVFLIALVWILRRNRGAPPPVATSKAVGAIFRAVGLANLFLVVVVGSIAWREQSLTIWLIYPCTVMVLQGAAWLAAYYLRRQPWLAVVAYGWLLTGVAMALSVDNNLAFIAATGFGLFAFMLVPGAVIMRQRGD